MRRLSLGATVGGRGQVRAAAKSTDRRLGQASGRLGGYPRLAANPNRIRWKPPFENAYSRRRIIIPPVVLAPGERKIAGGPTDIYPLLPFCSCHHWGGCGQRRHGRE